MVNSARAEWLMYKDRQHERLSTIRHASPCLPYWLFRLNRYGLACPQTLYGRPPASMAMCLLATQLQG